MVLGTGLASQFSFGKETTYGTPATLDHFLPVDKASIKQVLNTQQGAAYQGQLFNLGARRVKTSVGGAGDIETQITNRGMGLFCQNMMGTSVTPVLLTTPAYKQTHTFAIQSGKSLTMQSAMPTTDGTQRPYTFYGCKFSAVEFSYEVDKNLDAKWTVDAQQVVESVGVPAASYDSTLRQFVGTDVGITIGAYGSTTPATAALGVTKVTVKIERPLKVDRYYLGASGLKAEPLQNDFTKITGTIDAEFVSKTMWADVFNAQSGFSLQLTAVGAAIGASGSNDTFQITLPCVFLDGDTPMAESADVINGSFPFTVLFDGTNLPVITIISSEVTL